MNPFKAVNEFFKAFIDEYENGLGLIICNLLFWGVIYFIIWAILGFFGPYLLMLVLPVLFVPYFWAFCFWIGCNFDKEKTDLRFIWLVLPFLLAVFIYLNGIPGIFFGSFFDFIQSDWFLKSYYKFIAKWWKFFNAINYFASNKIPYKFYAFDLLWLQWIFIIPCLVGIPFIFYNQYEEKKEKVEAKKRAFIKEEKKARWKKERALREAKEKEERKHLEENQRKKEQEIKKKREARIKEIMHSNPWDSGFLG